VVNTGTGTGPAEVVPVVNGKPKTPVADRPVFDGLAITCPSATRCVLAGNSSTGAAVLQWLTGTKSTRVVAVPGIRDLTAVACASATSCVAVGSGPTSAAVAVFNPSTAAVRVTPVPGIVQLTSVACPSPTLCLAAGTRSLFPVQGPGVVVAVNSGKVAAPQVFPATFQLSSISCGSASTCWVSGVSGFTPLGSSQPMVGELTGGVPGNMVVVATGDKTSGPHGLSCVSANTCYGADGFFASGYGQADKVVNGKVAASVLVRALHYDGLGVITCPTAASCLAAAPTALVVKPRTNSYYTSATVSLGV
jgi:hypothetical protein